MAGVEFPNLPAYPIKQRLEVGGVNVVLLSIPPEENYPQNIFGLSETGDVLWQIEPRPSRLPNNKYTSIRDEIGIVVAKTEDRCERKIDAKSGRVLSEEIAETT
jgi:hypothetical protein